MRYIYLLTLLFILACATAPITGRKQLLLISAPQEAQMGVQAYQEILSKAKLSTNQAEKDRVMRVGQRIAKVSGVSNLKWEFNLIDDAKQVNAFALPGGKVAVYTGLLPITQTDTGLAVVIGHEIGHVIAHHGSERVSRNMLTQIGLETVNATIMQNNPVARNAVMSAFGLGVQVGAVLPFGRNQESEADHIGLELMAKAGFDPREAIPLWERMGNVGGDNSKRPPEFLSTHPDPRTRIAKMKGWLPNILRKYPQN